MIKLGCSVIIDSFITKKDRKVDMDVMDKKVFSMLSHLQNIGYDYCELCVGILKPLEMNMSEVSIIKKLRNLSFDVSHYNSFLPMKYKIISKKRNNEILSKYVNEVFERVKQAGGSSIGFGSAYARMAPYGYTKKEIREDIISFLNMCLVYADKYDIELNIEPLNKKETNTINTVAEAIEIAKIINHPRLGVLIDSFHMLSDSDDYTQISKEDFVYINHVHIAGKHRKSPKEFEIYHVNFINWLKEMGYDKKISIECLFDNFIDEAGDAFFFVKNILEGTIKEKRSIEYPKYLQVYDEKDTAAIVDTLKSNYLSVHTSSKISEFESKLAEYHEVPYAITTNSGTSALDMAIAALGIGIGDEVIVPGFSFIATAQAVLHNFAIPIFVDIDAESYNINADKIEAAITDKTKAVIVVHLFGNPADMYKITAIANKHSIYVIEDCSQSIGATIAGKKVGTFGDIGCYSFNEMKNISTGEGGAVITSDKTINSFIRKRRHGGLINDLSITIGYKYLMNGMQAALGISQLSRLDERNARRIYMSERLIKILSECMDLQMQKPISSAQHCYHRFVFCISEDVKFTVKEMQFELNKAGIILKPVYPIPLYKHPIFKRLGKESKFDIANYNKVNNGNIPDYNNEFLQCTESFCNREIGFNMTYLFTEEQIEWIGTSVCNTVTRLKSGESV